MASLSIYAEYVGLVGGTDVYRIDLSQVNLSSIQAITFHDDNVRSGGTAGASGADLDFVKLSTTYTASATEAASFAGLDAFDFSGSGVVYRPGYLWQWREWDDPLWYSSHLFGTGPGNVYSPTAATLGVRDGAEAASQGTLSLGEGGQVSFLLKNPVPTGYGGSTDPRYLYFGEYRGYGFSGDDYVIVTLSDEKAATAYSGNVTLYGTPSADSLILGQGVNAHLGSGHDFVSGQLGNDVIRTGPGNDRLFGGFHNDMLYGETGNDRLYGGLDNDWLYGGTGNDKLYGEAGHDRLFGQAGRDYLYGGTGNDWLYGGAGNDYLHGGSGKDAFFFNAKPHRTNLDRIADFNVKYDSIFLENSYFKVGKGSAARPLKLNQDMFVIGSQAADAEDRVIYDKDRGILYYDQDGTGSKAPIKIAILKKGLKMTYHDFFVI